MDKPDIEYDKPPEQLFGEPVPFDPEKTIDSIPIRPELLLDEKIAEAIETVIKDGQFVSAREFLISITEHYEPKPYSSPMGVRVTKAIEQIKSAFKEAGWIDSTEMAEYIAKHSVNVHTHRDAFIGPDSVTSVGIDNLSPPEIEYDPFGEPLMNGAYWLDKALRTIWEDRNEKDYFRSNEKFRESTITMADLETLLKRASGVTEAEKHREYYDAVEYGKRRKAAR